MTKGCILQTQSSHSNIRQTSTHKVAQTNLSQNQQSDKQATTHQPITVQNIPQSDKQAATHQPITAQISTIGETGTNQPITLHSRQSCNHKQTNRRAKIPLADKQTITNQPITWQTFYHHIITEQTFVKQVNRQPQPNQSQCRYSTIRQRGDLKPTNYRIS